MSVSPSKRLHYRIAAKLLYELGGLTDDDIMTMIHNGSLYKEDYEYITHKPYPEDIKPTAPVDPDKQGSNGSTATTSQGSDSKDNTSATSTGSTASQGSVGKSDGNATTVSNGSDGKTTIDSTDKSDSTPKDKNTTDSDTKK